MLSTSIQAVVEQFKQVFYCFKRWRWSFVTLAEARVTENSSVKCAFTCMAAKFQSIRFLMAVDLFTKLRDWLTNVSSQWSVAFPSYAKVKSCIFTVTFIAFISFSFPRDRSCHNHISAVTPFRCSADMPPEGSTRARILLGRPSLDRGSREAEVGFEPRTFWSVNWLSNH
ncbi:hypothetical protein T265_11113 [Opisthorchis viverrini]|uniref:Uncharacterized protein n=1 Tax=Opisthorchis viverrini TaxID=6198 RepID=A0A074ZYP7_OPIVI|nr:hypothetical protein T265_11113 [Opisthorchis viverrini]KER20304.1 hypothetical protein T265_11113 [Opisthorchis viverrini]